LLFIGFSTFLPSFSEGIIIFIFIILIFCSVCCFQIFNLLQFLRLGFKTFQL
jgi:hypothetical protein